METINYQGQDIRVTLVNVLSGSIPTSTVDHDGDEELFRDKGGSYYLRRRLNFLDSQGEELPASGRTVIHRISVTAAILWATVRLNSETLDLRRDAARLLRRRRAAACGNFVVAAGPAAAMTLREETMAKALKFARATGSDLRDVVQAAALQGLLAWTEDDDGAVPVRQSEGWAKFLCDVQVERERRLAVLDHRRPRASAMKWNTAEDLADGGMVVCLHLKPDPARLLRATCLLDEMKPVDWIYDQIASDVNCALGGNGRADEKKREAIFEANRPDVEEPERMTVQLEEAAAALVRRYMEASQREFGISQVVNGAVSNALEMALVDYEKHSKRELSAYELMDGAWGYLEEEILRASGTPEEEIAARANYFERRKESPIRSTGRKEAA